MTDAPGSLHELAREAAALAGDKGSANAQEAARQLTICNACRYCEGYCAVFPAMTRRLVFTPSDVHYLANLCHQCGACFHACQYAPPHDFAVNVPQVFAQVRHETYAAYAWPHAFATAYRRNGTLVAMLTALGVALFLLLAVLRGQPLLHAPLAGDFYAVFPHGLMVALFGTVFAFALLALGIGGVRFWRATTVGAPSLPATTDALHAITTLRYLDGGHGDGCNDEDDAFTHRRRVFHHLTAYGFALCFASTSVATAYHYLLGQPAPYAPTSLPVLLGTVGGLGLLAGPAGLLWLHARRDPRTMDAAQAPMDRAFMLLLFTVSASGLALLAGRDGGAMALLLCVHLGFVFALFATLPYGKFAHGVYRALALLKWAIERRKPNPVSVGSD
jgi:citrate/tricarballylate utilization protein